MAVVRYDINFTGRVQGVGFRATTVSVAQSYRVQGWVRNEPDGSVRCVAEGDPDELDRFLAAVKQSMSSYIREARVNRTAATGEFRSFGVRH